MFCSVDALGHSLESHVSATRGNEFARAMSSRAISMILNGYADMILHGEEFRTNLLENFIIASCMGGMSVNNSGAGPVHALAYPLGEKYKMSHGESIYQFLTVVFGMYRSRIFSPCLDELTMLLSPPLQRAGFFTSEKNIYVDLHKMLNAVYPLPPLSACGMTVEDIPVFADSILKNKQRLLSTSPILLTRDDIIELYSKRFAGEI